MELYRQIAACSPGCKNQILTVLEGENFGEKALFTDGTLRWESRTGGFFSGITADVTGLEDTGVFFLSGIRVFCEFTAREQKLVICGGGHVSIPVIRMARMIGCSVTVLEDRPSFAANAERAGADRVICRSFEEGLAEIPGDPDTFFVIVTRGHQHDQTCLRLIAEKEHAYIGMMGSRSRTAGIKEALRKSGTDPAVLEKVHTPIGLPIGAETPEEIGISILAEIIQVKNKSRRRGGFTKEILRALLEDANDGTKKILATIVARKGSAPRETGTKMLIYSDGRFAGTIGGGRLEADILQEALRLAEYGKASPLLRRFDMSSSDAGEDGMVCGGTVEVLLEPLL